jgi:serine/threonine-protein kinase HipA
MNDEASIRSAWSGDCDEAEMSAVDRSFLWRQQFFNDYAFEGYDGSAPTDH